MTREITSHKSNSVNEEIKIDAVDAPAGGANHHYRLSIGGNVTKDEKPIRCDIRFQNGPVLEVGFNGFTNESLLAIVIDRLKAFQETKFKCRENSMALMELEQALNWLHDRTNDRAQRHVEGTMQV